MTRPTTGIRRVDRIEEGGWLACLYGPTDLDDLLVELELEWPEDGAPLPRGAFIGVQPWN